MAHTCNRCRTSYESGGFYGGHDYCVTCVVRVQEEERQQKAEEKRREQEIRLIQGKKKEELIHRMLEEKQRRHQGELKREAEIIEEKKEREIALQKIRAAGAKDVGRQRHDWNITIAKPPGQQTQTADVIGAGQPKKLAPLPRPPSGTQMPGRRHILERPEEAAKKKREKAKEKVAVSLVLKDGLPVSLSVGQTGIKTQFIAKNTSTKKLTLEFSVVIEDSKKKRIVPVLEPKQCVLEPDSEVPMRADFDLPVETETGPLAFTAQLHENAIYVDREGAKSEPIVLTSQVKTPMWLEYRPGSAEFEKQEDGTLALALVFENTGETGGFLFPRSSVGYGLERKMKRAALTGKTKIKGKQKKARLVFSPAEETAIDFLVFDLTGTDANGKEFKLQKSINVKGRGAEEGGKGKGNEGAGSAKKEKGAESLGKKNTG